MKHTIAYIATFDIPFYASYTCSKCHALNELEQRISIKRRAISAAGAEERANKVLKKRLAAIENGDYKNAEYNCRCRKCKNVEPWSKMHFAWFETAWLWLLPLPIFIIVMFVLTGSDWTTKLKLAALIVVGIYAVSYGVWFLWKNLKWAVLEITIKRLPLASLPRASLKKEVVFSKATIDETKNSQSGFQSKEEAEYVHNAIEKGKTFDDALAEYRHRLSSKVPLATSNNNWKKEPSDDLAIDSKRIETVDNTSFGHMFVADELTKLKKLLDGGILTEEEFAQQKAKLLGNKK